jgi:hypothetical protein
VLVAGPHTWPAIRRSLLVSAMARWTRRCPPGRGQLPRRPRATIARQ